MDKIELSLLGIGALAVVQLLGDHRKKSTSDSQLLRFSKDDEHDEHMEYVIPGIALNEFVSPHYDISFKYPKGWVKNPRYADKYEGETGFFEVGSFSGLGENIDEAVNAQINEYYKPYGTNPTVRKFVVDGEPARVIYPSDDQSEFFKDREAAIVIKYPSPVELEGREFDYVVVWVSQDYVPLILSTFKFLREPE